MSERGVERKCRSEACGKWTFFPTGDPAKACSFCGAEYGHVSLGMDVLVKNSPKPRHLKAQSEATSIPRPKPGEIGWRGR